MTFDWTVTMGSVLTMVGFVASMIVGYYSMQRDVERRFADVMTRVDDRFSVLNVRLEKIFEGDIRELRARILTVKERHEELTKDVIARSHAANDQLNTLILKVDRLERPGVGDH